MKSVAFVESLYLYLKYSLPNSSILSWRITQAEKINNFRPNFSFYIFSSIFFSLEKQNLNLSLALSESNYFKLFKSTPWHAFSLGGISFIEKEIIKQVDAKRTCTYFLGPSSTGLTKQALKGGVNQFLNTPSA